MAADRILLSVLVLALTALPSGAVAQEWAPVASSDADTQAVGARWPGGALALARCSGGEYDLIFSLPEPVASEVVRVSTRAGADPASYPASWRMAPGGRAAFARQPVGLSESWLRGGVLHLTFGSAEEVSLEAPANGDALVEVMEGCGHSLDLDQPEQPLVITNPDWESRPDVWIMRRYYPRIAALNGRGGEVDLSCLVGVDGRLEDCIVEREEPRGLDFGTASIALASEFRMTPRTVNGRPVGEALIFLPLRWTWDDDR